MLTAEYGADLPWSTAAK